MILKKKMNIGNYKRCVFIVITSAIFFSCYSQSQQSLRETIETQPKTLSEAIYILDNRLDPTVKEEIKRTKREELFKYHLGIGMDIRNRWRLWHDSELAMWFKKNGIYHADDMSSLVLDAYWKYLNDMKINLRESVAVLRQNYDKLSASIDSSGVVTGGRKKIPLPDPENVIDKIIELNWKSQGK